jgi:single-strand DNA-binding protein
MANSINKAFVLGNLVRDPEVRRSQSGESIVSLTVATNESWKDKASGEWKEKSEFHRVVIFNENLAKLAEDRLRKGSKIALEGQLQTRKWTDNAGVEKYSTEIVLQRFRGELVILDGAGNGERAESGSNAGFSGRRPSPAGGGRPSGNRNQDAFDLDDSIPFEMPWK